MDRSRRDRAGGVQRRSVPRFAVRARSELEARGAHAIARLSKRNVEALLATYDADPVAALTVAMRIVLDRHDAAWPELIQAAGFEQSRTAALMLGEHGALDQLAANLNELRLL